jgi:hypothetical protein
VAETHENCRNPKVHCGAHNGPLLALIISQINTVHTPTAYFSPTHFNTNSYLMLYYNSNKVWRILQVVRLLILQFSAT